MSIPFVLDENCRGPLWQAIQSHNGRGIDLIDAVQVGAPVDLPLTSPDPVILAWAERTGRILITFDEKTMPRHWLAHIGSGCHSPGVLILRRRIPLPEIVENMAILAHASHPGEWSNRLEYFP